MAQDVGFNVDDDTEDEFAPRPKRRLGKLTILLAAMLVAGAGFLGGVQLQKHSGDTSSGRAGARGGFSRAGGGFPTSLPGDFSGGFSGGFGGRGQGSGGGASAQPSAQPSAAQAATPAAQAATPAVIGTIVSVSGDTMVVKNFGGKLVTVTLTSGTAITKSVGASELQKGATVTVSGTTGADGKITATAVGAK